MKITIQKIAINFLALTIKGIILLFQFLIVRPGKFLGRLLFRVTLPLYDVYLTLKRVFIKFYSPIQNKHRLIHPFARRYFIHIIIITISLLVATSNLNALEIKTDEIGSDNILSFMVRDDDLGEYEVIYEEGPIQVIPTTQYLENGAVKKDAFIDYDGFEIIESNTQTSGGAVVRPIVPAENAQPARTDVVAYTVQEGDTISTIARQFGVSINTVLWENKINDYTIIRPGQTLSILPISGIRHTVVSGETITKIAKKYSVTEEEIIEFNRLASAHDIKISEQLIIPGGKKQQVVQTFSLRKLAAPATPKPAEASAIVLPGLGKLVWPSACKRISQYYHWRHHGVDIACEKGTRITAAADGVVIKSQSGWNGGYGIMIVLDHGDGVQTLYGHLSEIFVKVGDEVKLGHALGIQGSTGRSTGPHLHFEIRRSGTRINPVSLIK